MKNIFRFLVIFIFLFTSFPSDSYAQNQSRKMRKAEEAFSLEKYTDAIELYKKAYKKTKNRSLKAEIIFKQGECYRMSSRIKQAQIYYKRAIKSKYPDVIVYLRYADVLRMLGDLDEAVVQYKKYIQLNPNDVRGEMGLKSCNFALKWKDLPTRYNVSLMPVVNSRFSDFSPAFGNSDYSELYFTSTNKGGISDKIDSRTGEYFSDVWFTKMNKKGIWSRPIVLSEPLNSTGNDGSVYVNKRGTVIYLTQCRVEKKKDLGCGIYISERRGKLWGATQLLQIKTDSGATVGHPALNYDESIMIFSSDMNGGYGGKDLWISVKGKRNRWSDPINLGPLVNTPGDEMFPFLADDGTIYFASNGHIGMGGFDIYKTEKDQNGAYLLPVNLKAPVNSFADDFGMIIEKNGERGFLTSNRSGGKGSDDIYQFELPALELSVQGIVTDAKTGAILTETKVQLIGSDSSKDETTTDNTGKYSFKLNPLTSYEIIVDREGYLTKIERETTEGIELNKVFMVDLMVSPVKKEIILPLIKYDFNKFDLRPESISDLDNLAEALIDNPEVIIELKSHTDFVGSSLQNKRLSQKRADACVEYLISKGIKTEQLVARGMGENEPFVIEVKDGRFKVGDVLTESYIRKILFRKNREVANQYNRRTSFKVLINDSNRLENQKK
ncbi:MAG: OmpA family protein [Flavobacteriales bacterium]|nr:OmpA family protein [Flavobacteriales bacterium]